MRSIETYQAIHGLLTLPEWMPHLLLFLRDEAALAAAPYGVPAAAQVDAQSEGPDVGGLWTRLPQLFGIGPMASAEDPTYAMLSTLVPPQAPETADGGIGDDVPSQAERRASTADILAICEAVARTRASDDVCAALEGGLDDDMDLDCAWLVCGDVQCHTPHSFLPGVVQLTSGRARPAQGGTRVAPTASSLLTWTPCEPHTRHSLWHCRSSSLHSLEAQTSEPRRCGGCGRRSCRCNVSEMTRPRLTISPSSCCECLAWLVQREVSV